MCSQWTTYLSSLTYSSSMYMFSSLVHIVDVYAFIDCLCSSRYIFTLSSFRWYICPFWLLVTVDLYLPWTSCLLRSSSIYFLTLTALFLRRSTTPNTFISIHKCSTKRPVLAYLVCHYPFADCPCYSSTSSSSKFASIYALSYFSSYTNVSKLVYCTKGHSTSLISNIVTCSCQSATTSSRIRMCCA